MGSSASKAKKNDVPQWWESPALHTTLAKRIEFVESERAIWTGDALDSISEILLYSWSRHYHKIWAMDLRKAKLELKTEVREGDCQVLKKLQHRINSYPKSAEAGHWGEDFYTIIKIGARQYSQPNGNVDLGFECSIWFNFLKKLEDIFPLLSRHRLLKTLTLVVDGEIEIGKSPVYKSRINVKFDLMEINKSHRTLTTQRMKLQDPIPFRAVRNAFPFEKIRACARVTLEWSDKITSPIKMTRDPRILQSLRTSKDFAIVAENGAEVKCHKFVLSSSSPVFAAMLSPTTGMKEFHDGKLKMRGCSETAVRHFIRFLYEQEIPSDLKCDLALELLQMGHMYELEQLWKPIYNLMLQKRGRWFSKDAIIELYYFLRNLEECDTLTNHLLGMMKKMTTEEIRSYELEPTEVADLVAIMYDLK